MNHSIPAARPLSPALGKLGRRVSESSRTHKPAMYLSESSCHVIEAKKKWSPPTNLNSNDLSL